MKFSISETDNRKGIFSYHHCKFIYNTMISSVYYNYWQFNFAANRFTRNFTTKKTYFLKNS